MSILLLENLLLESGIRNINELAKRYKKAKIYFHQDLDGVTTAIGMKNYLERNGIKVVDAEIIQYGDKEFSIKKPDASGEVMPVLVDFAHGKPMFTIHTDHHDTQVGVEKGASTSFRHSRSNVETISNVVSTSDIFPSQDIMMISTIDSADYARLDITPDDVMNFVFNLDKGKNLQRNKISMALVTNKLLLAYKNKPKFLETLVMRCTPSLLNIFQNITKLVKEFGYATAQEMKANLEDYIKKQSTSKDVQYDSEYGIIKQYGGGSMFKAGSYDRYVPFKLYPEANFLVITWPLGLLQASCNPFKKSRELKGVNLGEIAQEVLETYKSELKNKIITIDSVKYFAEKNKEFSEDSVGFSYEDMIAILGDTENGIMGLNQIPKGASPDYTLERWQNAIKKIMSKSYNELTERESKALKMLSVNGWDMIQANSGGHKCITNISGLSYFGKDGVPFLKKFSDEFVFKLKQKIDGENVSENIFTKKKLLKEINESKKEPINEGLNDYLTMIGGVLVSYAAIKLFGKKILVQLFGLFARGLITATCYKELESIMELISKDANNLQVEYKKIKDYYQIIIDMKSFSSEYLFADSSDYKAGQLQSDNFPAKLKLYDDGTVEYLCNTGEIIRKKSKGNIYDDFVNFIKSYGEENPKLRGHEEDKEIFSIIRKTLKPNLSSKVDQYNSLVSMSQNDIDKISSEISQKLEIPQDVISSAMERHQPTEEKDEETISTDRYYTPIWDFVSAVYKDITDYNGNDSLKESDLARIVKRVIKENESNKTNEFNDIYNKMWGKMLNQVCMKYTKNKDEAEDFCQNGFIKVYKNLSKYDEKGSLEGWVRRVINNSILDDLRKKKLSFVSGGDEGFDFSRYNIGDEEYEEEFSIEDIEKVLPQLSPGFRKAFELHYIDGLKYDEVGKKLGISTSTAKTNAMRAKNKIKEFLGY